MRNRFYGLCLVALMFSPQLAAAAGNTPSASGTTIPTATQIVDSALNVWTLAGGQAYENSELTPSSGVILLLCYGGIVYQENIHHNWWVWANGAWAVSSDPRVESPSSTTVPAATQLVDSEHNVWTLSGGQAFRNGQLTPSSGVILLLYAKGIVYQENIHHDWWRWSDGAWAATSAPLAASASGTTIPTATQIVDSELDVWTLSDGQAYENHALTPSSGVILLLFFGGNVYQENIHHNWWRWTNGAWVATASDPRVGQPLAYVGTENNTVAIIDTGTNRVVGTIPLGFAPASIAVTPDAKHLYVGSSNGSGESGSVAVIETLHDTVVATLPVTFEPTSIVVSPDGTRVYVEGGYTDAIPITVSVIDTATNVVVANIDTTGEGPVGIAISPDGKRVYVPCAGGLDPFGFLAVINTTTDSLAPNFLIPGSQAQRFYAAAVTPDNAKLYANTWFYPPGLIDLIAVMNPVTGALITTIPDSMTVGIFSPDSPKMYGLGLGGVAVMNTATNAVTTAVANLPGAYALAITPDGRHLFITDRSTNSVAVADTSTYTISTLIGGIDGAGPIAIVPAHLPAAPAISAATAAFRQAPTLRSP
jgi:YVTN family beta-propeller protein